MTDNNDKEGESSPFDRSSPRQWPLSARQLPAHTDSFVQEHMMLNRSDEQMRLIRTQNRKSLKNWKVESSNLTLTSPNRSYSLTPRSGSATSLIFKNQGSEIGSPRRQSSPRVSHQYSNQSPKRKGSMFGQNVLSSTSISGDHGTPMQGGCGSPVDRNSASNGASQTSFSERNFQLHAHSQSVQDTSSSNLMAKVSERGSGGLCYNNTLPSGPHNPEIGPLSNSSSLSGLFGASGVTMKSKFKKKSIKIFTAMTKSTPKAKPPGDKAFTFDAPANANRRTSVDQLHKPSETNNSIALPLSNARRSSEIDIKPSSHMTLSEVLPSASVTKLQEVMDTIAPFNQVPKSRTLTTTHTQTSSTTRYSLSSDPSRSLSRAHSVSGQEPPPQSVKLDRLNSTTIVESEFSTTGNEITDANASTVSLCSTSNRIQSPTMVSGKARATAAKKGLNIPADGVDAKSTPELSSASANSPGTESKNGKQKAGSRKSSSKKQVVVRPRNRQALSAKSSQGALQRQTSDSSTKSLNANANANTNTNDTNANANANANVKQQRVVVAVGGGVRAVTPNPGEKGTSTAAGGMVSTSEDALDTKMNQTASPTLGIPARGRTGSMSARSNPPDADYIVAELDKGARYFEVEQKPRRVNPSIKQEPTVITVLPSNGPPVSLTQATLGIADASTGGGDKVLATRALSATSLRDVSEADEHDGDAPSTLGGAGVPQFDRTRSVQERTIPHQQSRDSPTVSFRQRKPDIANVSSNATSKAFTSEPKRTTSETKRTTSEPSSAKAAGQGTGVSTKEAGRLSTPQSARAQTLTSPRKRVTDETTFSGVRRGSKITPRTNTLTASQRSEIIPWDNLMPPTPSASTTSTTDASGGRDANSQSTSNLSANTLSVNGAGGLTRQTSRSSTGNFGHPSAQAAGLTKQKSSTSVLAKGTRMARQITPGTSFFNTTNGTSSSHTSTSALQQQWHNSPFNLNWPWFHPSMEHYMAYLKRRDEALRADSAANGAATEPNDSSADNESMHDISSPQRQRTPAAFKRAVGLSKSMVSSSSRELSPLPSRKPTPTSPSQGVSKTLAQASSLLGGVSSANALTNVKVGMRHSFQLSDRANASLNVVPNADSGSSRVSLNSIIDPGPGPAAGNGSGSGSVSGTAERTGPAVSLVKASMDEVTPWENQEPLSKTGSSGHLLGVSSSGGDELCINAEGSGAWNGGSHKEQEGTIRTKLKKYTSKSSFTSSSSADKHREKTVSSFDNFGCLVLNEWCSDKVLASMSPVTNYRARKEPIQFVFMVRDSRERVVRLQAQFLQDTVKDIQNTLVTHMVKPSLPLGPSKGSTNHHTQDANKTSANAASGDGADGKVDTKQSGSNSSLRQTLQVDSRGEMRRYSTSEMAIANIGAGQSSEGNKYVVPENVDSLQQDEVCPWDDVQPLKAQTSATTASHSVVTRTNSRSLSTAGKKLSKTLSTGSGTSGNEQMRRGDGKAHSNNKVEMSVVLAAGPNRGSPKIDMPLLFTAGPSKGHNLKKSGSSKSRNKNNSSSTSIGDLSSADGKHKDKKDGSKKGLSYVAKKRRGSLGIGSLSSNRVEHS